MSTLSSLVDWHVVISFICFCFEKLTVLLVEVHYILINIQELYKNCINCLLEEITGIWCDVLIAVVVDVWKKCKRGNH